MNRVVMLTFAALWLALSACAQAATPAPPTSEPAGPTAARATSPVAAQSASAAALPPVSGDVTVFAAASLTDVFNDMAQAFKAANPQASVTFNFGSSSALAIQLDQGAQADVFASADQTQMNQAKTAGHIDGPDRIFATNRLVIITPKENPAGVHSVADLAKPGLKLVTAQPAVPIGVYTQSLLDTASKDAQYGTDFGSRVHANIVSQETDDRQIVAQVELGEADAAVVYKTDMTPTSQATLASVDIPDTLNTLVSYPIAVTSGGANRSGGSAFVAFVMSPAGQAILAKWNFVPAHPAS